MTGRCTDPEARFSPRLSTRLPSTTCLRSMSARKRPSTCTSFRVRIVVKALGNLVPPTVALRRMTEASQLNVSLSRATPTPIATPTRTWSHRGPNTGCTDDMHFGLYAALCMAAPPILRTIPSIPRMAMTVDEDPGKIETVLHETLLLCLQVCIAIQDRFHSHRMQQCVQQGHAGAQPALQEVASPPLAYISWR